MMNEEQGKLNLRERGINLPKDNRRKPKRGSGETQDIILTIILML